jgi:3-deoxy-D-arabino-heptulosonate 7-phosphate (DAHP) synthase
VQLATRQAKESEQIMSIEITEIISINHAPHIPTRIVIIGKEGCQNFEILSAYCKREHAIILATKLGIDLKIQDFIPEKPELEFEK